MYFINIQRFTVFCAQMHTCTPFLLFSTVGCLYFDTLRYSVTGATIISVLVPELVEGCKQGATCVQLY